MLLLSVCSCVYLCVRACVCSWQPQLPCSLRTPCPGTPVDKAQQGCPVLSHSKAYDVPHWAAMNSLVFLNVHWLHLPHELMCFFLCVKHKLDVFVVVVVLCITSCDWFPLCVLLFISISNMCVHVYACVCVSVSLTCHLWYESRLHRNWGDP